MYMFVPESIAICKVKKRFIYMLTDYATDERICFDFKEDALQWAWARYCEDTRADGGIPTEEEFNSDFHNYFDLEEIYFRYRQDMGVNGRI